VKWTKLGLLFDPAQHQLTDGCASFAQSPQALVFDDFVRIYFSTRRQEANGQYLSFISYVEVDRELQAVLRVADHPVMPLGVLGSFDEHGIFPINVMRHGTEVRAYTCGWSRRVSVPVETAIGLATSQDEGRTFTRIGPGPIMGPTPEEPFLVGDPFVIVTGGRWHMWYIYGTAWASAGPAEGPARVYKIAHASSADGLAWTRDAATIVPNRIGDDECQALPTVFQCDGRWHMYFCYRYATDFRRNHARGYRLGYAYSDDLRHWVRDDAAAGIDVSASGWDSEMQCYPHTFWCGDQVYLLYNGNAFGRSGFGVARLER
jgi:predicted GH43/DUF377 family glycosyl hydrolase